MLEGNIDDAYTLELLKKINGLSYNGDFLANSLFYNGYNLWHLSQQRLLENTRAFSKTRRFIQPTKQDSISFLKDSMGRLLFVAHSIISYLFLVITRKEILIYSIDKASTQQKTDFRLAELYEALHQSGVGYFELFHTILNRESFRNLITRHRFSMYLEALDYVFFLLKWFCIVSVPNIEHIEHIDLSSYTEDEQKYIRQQLEKIYIRAQIAIFKIKILSRLFKYTNLKTLFAIDDGAYYFECLQACKEAGIKTYAIQHGLFTKYNVGALKNINFKGEYIAPDYVLVWSEYWKNELIRLGTNFKHETIIVGGLKEKSNPVSVQDNRLNVGTNIIVLIPYETVAPKYEIKEYIVKLLECPQINVIFKLRADRTSEEQLSEYGITKDLHPRFSTIIDIVEVLPRVTIVMGSYSTFLYDMLMCNKHIVIMKTSSDFGMPMVYNGIADVFDKESDDFCKSIRALAEMSPHEFIQRREKLLGLHPRILKETLREIIENQ